METSGSTESRASNIASVSLGKTTFIVTKVVSIVFFTLLFEFG